MAVADSGSLYEAERTNVSVQYDPYRRRVPLHPLVCSDGPGIRPSTFCQTPLFMSALSTTLDIASFVDDVGHRARQWFSKRARVRPLVPEGGRRRSCTDVSISNPAQQKAHGRASTSTFPSVPHMRTTYRTSGQISPSSSFVYAQADRR
ncbi:hypothetical protein MRX96_008747 [Rhipicephalus microplus]